ncbi:MAG: autotransporter outer membrane beta-barrel domain-containing protein [Phascolarctobacterium sp.]|nr:autotransporter outer membrane beta-barrel domain-containing protein [Phascolarctobacterium sp.]
MKISSTKKAAILATVLGGFVLGHSAEAANLGVVTASDYATSHMGAVQGSYINSDDITVVKSVITDLNRDPAVYNTIDPVTGKSSLYIRQYNYSTTNLQNSYAFDAQGDWNNRAAGNTSKAVNAHDVVRYNNYVYVASYDEGTVGIAQVVQDDNGTDKNILDLPTLAVNLKQDLIDYAGKTFSSKAQLHGEGVVIVDGNLYVIANVNPEGGYKPYNDSYLMKYVIQKDGSLKYDGYATMGKNTDSVALNVYNNYILTTAIGGYQNYGAANSNAETSLNVATIHPDYNYLQKSSAITLPENLLQVRDGQTIPKSEFRSLKVMPNGTAYVMTYNIGTGGDNVDVTVYQTTVSNLLSSNPQNWKEVYSQKGAPGWFGRLDAEYNTKRLWVQVGNKLNIYTDGATTPISYGTSDFATSTLYNELYTWDIIGTDVIPEGNLVKLKLPEGTLAEQNANAVLKKEDGTNITAIKNQIIANISGANPVIDLTTADEGNLENNVLAGIYAEGTSSTVNAKNGVQIQVENNIASPVGIYTGEDGSLKVNATNGNVNILTKTMDGGNTLTNAVWLDPTIVGGESITIDAKATNITMEGGYGGNGVAIQKTDRWGENSKDSALGGDITIKGDLNIKGQYSDQWGIGANPSNVLSRFNNAGIFVDVNNSSVEVKGNVDMDVYGNGVTVNGKNATVTLAKGGTITVPTGTDYGYYALAAYDGTINMNKSAGNNDVKLNGDIFAIKGATINLGLATGASHLNGIIDNGGTVNLTLKNGATWTNVANNTRYEQDNEDVGNGEKSRVTTLTGGASLNDAGVIIQEANSDLLQIDNLKGAVKINYTAQGLDDKGNNNILGGDVTIGSAAVGSIVSMISSNNAGIKTSDTAEVEKVLEAIANKLYYTGYKTGENNLTAVALGLSEGLTASSVTKQTNIKFDKATGQGSITGEITGEDNSVGGSTGGGTGGDDIVQDPTVPAFPDVKYHEDPLYDNDIFVDATPDNVIDTTEAIRPDGKRVVTGIHIKDGDKDTTGYTLYKYINRIQVEGNDEYRPVGIYVDGIDSYVNVSRHSSYNKNGEPIDIVTKLADDSKERTNAVWIETVAGEPNNKRVRLETKGLNISMLGGNGGNGVAITASGGAETSQNYGQILIDGDLRIKGTEGKQWGIGNNPENTDARYNNSGILVEVDGKQSNKEWASEHTYVQVNGSVYLDVCGNGITVDAARALVKTGAIIGNNNTLYNPYQGSQILVPRGDSNHKYYSLAAYEGNIYFDNEMNGNFNYIDTTPTHYAHNTVPYGGMIDGDWYVGDNGLIDTRFKGNEAYFNGIVDNNGGTANLYMVDGATWTNVSTNGETGVTSHLTNFRGTDLSVGSGTSTNYADAKIIQTKDSGDILIDKFHNNATVIYAYDESNPTTFLGGTVTIINAADNSKLTLQTNYSDAITVGNVDDVMNSLAGMLTYTGYTTGENNLSAQVKIGEGLTASSITTELLAKEIIDSVGNVDSTLEDKVAFDKDSGTLNGNIQFDTNSGKGSLGSLKVDDGSTTPDQGGSEDSDYYYGKEIFDNPPSATLQNFYGTPSMSQYTIKVPIYGDVYKDKQFVNSQIGILKRVDGKDGYNVYDFTKPDVKFTINNIAIPGGAWHKDISTAISATGDLSDKVYKTIINLNDNNLTITNNSRTTGSGASISAVDGGVVEINSPGNITITENGQGPTAGIFANSGGLVHIKNSDGGVVKITTKAGGSSNNITSYGTAGAGIKTMNGVEGLRSKVIIEGLVDIVADLKYCNNEALSAVASTIEIGGGNIQAINGAWAAIRAYGEFVSDNAAIVNVNVTKDEAGNITGAGERTTTIKGDFVTNGGMGTLGYITVGLNGEGSYWTGNYGDNRGYGVTQGQEGNVTLYMKDGAKWTGFSDGEMNVTMEGDGTTWYGFNIAEREPDAMGEVNGGLNLTLTDGALWQNAITKDQGTDSKVYNFVGNAGFIDMTGEKTFIGHNDASHGESSNGVSHQNTSIEEKGQQETGNMKITNYSGNTTVIYRRDVNNVTQVLGGTTTIEHAEKGSKITLSTDGYNVLTNSQVAETLDNLAEKLYYTNYIQGENNLKGYVQIAEGLTTASVGKHVGSIAFSSASGQGSLKEGSLVLNGGSTGGGDDNTQGGGDNTGDNNQGGTTGGGDGEGTVTPETPVVPEEPEEVEVGFNTGITGGSLTEDDNYKEYVTEEGTLDLGSLEGDNGEAVGSVKIEVAETEADNVVISSNSSDANVVIDMGGKELTVSGTTTGEGTKADGISASNGGTVEIKQAGNINIVTNAEKGTATAIRAEGANTNIIIENAELGGVVTLEANANNVKGEGVLYATEGASVKIDGLVDITKTNGNTAINVGKDSKVELGGGKFGADKDKVAIKVTEGGAIKINKDGKKRDVVIDGKILFGVKHQEQPVEQAAVWSLRSLRAMPVANSTDSAAGGESRSITLATAGSSWNNDLQYEGSGANDFEVNISNGAKWNGNSLGGVDLSVVLNDGGVWQGYHEEGANDNSALNMTIANGAQWDNQTATAATTVTSLQGAGEGEQSGYIRMSENADVGLTVKDYSGETTFIYNHDADNNIQGGNVTINKAADGSVVNVRTNSIGTSDKEEVTKVLQALAAKMIAQDEDGKALTNTDKLSGEAQIAEGIVTSASALKVGNINFTNNGTGELDVESITARYPDSGYIYGDSETAMMKGAKSAMASTVMMWRSESNDILQRMGDLRLATEDSGVWAKYYGGKYEMDAQKTNFTTSYKAYQVGYDKAVGNGWNVGVAVSHNEGDSHYDLGGKGDTTVTSLSVYGNKDYGDGRYLGLIVKGSQLKNEYEVFNNDGYKLEGDYKTWGTSISAEYGKRIEKGNGFYFDPSVELTIGHVQGKDYTATSNLLAAYGKTATMDVEQDSFNSIVGRIGFGIGQQMDKASYYAKLALAHEFGGSFDTRYTAEETKGTSIDFGDTWYEMQIGGTAKLSDNSLLYATYERSFGGDVTEKWRLDAGLRITF